MISTLRSSPVPSLSVPSMWAVGLCALLFVCAPLSLAEKVAAPEISPPVGTYSPDPPDSGNPPVVLTMETTTPDATILYVIVNEEEDGTGPPNFGLLGRPYHEDNKPQLAEDGEKFRVWAQAYKEGYEDSDLVSQGLYIIHAPVIQLTGSLYMGQVPVGEFKEATLRIWNQGDLDLKVSGINFYQVGTWTPSEVCEVALGVLYPFTIEPLLPGGSNQPWIDIGIYFTPREAKNYVITVVVESSAASGNDHMTASVTGTVEVEPLIGGAHVEGLVDWFLSDWFGYYNTSGAPWLFHAQHGFVYRHPSSTNASMLIYDDAMGAWWWTSESDYPFLYVFDPPADNAGTDIEEAWLYYFEGTKTPRSFAIVTGASAGGFLFFNP